jgi:hypothetical protein
MVHIVAQLTSTKSRTDPRDAMAFEARSEKEE